MLFYILKQILVYLLFEYLYKFLNLGLQKEYRI